MRAILIDPYAQCVTEVQIPDEGQLAAMYRMMGCRTVQVVQATPVLDLWLDDNGRGLEYNGAFKCSLGRLVQWPDFVGPAILVAYKQGKDGIEMSGLPPQLTVDVVEKTIIWLRKGSKPFMRVVAFDETQCEGAFDGNTVHSDADPGL